MVLEETAAYGPPQSLTQDATTRAMYSRTTLSPPRLEKQRSQHQGNGTQQFNDHVQRWTSRILERIADCIPHHCRFVGL